MCDATVLTRPLFHPVFFFWPTLSLSQLLSLCVCTSYYSTYLRVCPRPFPLFWTSFSILFKPFPCPSKAFQLTGHLEASASWVPLLGRPVNTAPTGAPLTLSTPRCCARRGLQANGKGRKHTFRRVSWFLSGRVATNRLVTTGD